MDFMKPLMNGSSSLRRCGLTLKLPHIPIIMLSRAQESIGLASQEVVDAVLNSPYNEQKLISAVTALLSEGC